MPSKESILQTLLNPGVIAVIRLSSAESMLPLCNALVNGGIIALEITMTTPRALGCISEVSREFGSRALVGVGSVTSGLIAKQAIDAGAEFVVSPITKKEIADTAQRHGKPVMLGAFTPTEAQTAFEAGADFIKIFPAEQLGPGYIKSLKAPLPHLKIVPTGGVDLSTLTEFFKAGCSAVGVGSSLLQPSLLQNKDWSGLTELARKFVALRSSII